MEDVRHGEKEGPYRGQGHQYVPEAEVRLVNCRWVRGFWKDTGLPTRVLTKPEEAPQGLSLPLGRQIAPPPEENSEDGLGEACRVTAW